MFNYFLTNRNFLLQFFCNKLIFISTVIWIRHPKRKVSKGKLLLRRMQKKDNPFLYLWRGKHIDRSNPCWNPVNYRVYYIPLRWFRYTNVCVFSIIFMYSQCLYRVPKNNSAFQVQNLIATEIKFIIRQ